MPFARGWFRWGSMGLGRGMGMGRGLGMGRGTEMGRGNLYPFCRFYTLLPRRWWAMPSYAGLGALPFKSGAGYLGTTPYPPQMSPKQEVDFLREETNAIKAQLDEIEARIKELEKEQK